jgi:chromosome segregation ATPase
MISTFDQFKLFVSALIRTIAQKGDAAAAAAQAKIAELSAGLEAANQTIQALQAKNADLQTAIAAKDAALVTAEAVKVNALTEQAAETITQLNDLSSALEAEFNPTPATDAAAEAIAESTVTTPAAIESSETIGESTPTPAAVLDAVIEAVESQGE